VKPLAWYKELNPQGKRTFWACFGGWATDGMDVQIYSFVIPALLSLWKLSKSDAGLLSTSTLLLSAFGGWITGILADRVGRVRMLQITIAWFSFFTFLSRLAPNFTSLLVIRGLQGLGFGGEWAAGSVLMAEVINATHRGKAVGMVQSSWSIGWGVAALLATALFQLLPQSLAWRCLFFFGIAPALLIFFIRRSISEPAVFRHAASEQKDLVTAVRSIFGPRILFRTAFGSLLAIGAQGGYYAITSWLPTFLQTERHLTVLSSGGYLAVIICASFVGYTVSAYLNDLIGRRLNFIVFAVGSLVIVLSYTQLHIDDRLMLILGFPLGFFASGIFSGMGAFFTELFPTAIRANAQGFCYNFGRGIAAAFPWLVGILAASLPLGQAIGIYAGVAYLTVVVAALVLPETKGRDLATIK
jgi:MFS family permease